MHQWKKKILGSVVVFMFLFTMGTFLNKTEIWSGFQLFFGDYTTYINSDIENKAKLFESIISGLCAGSVTYGALFITILHENKKNHIFWMKERQKEKEERLFAVRPFLNIETRSVSVVRDGDCDEEKDFIKIGEGKKYQYAHTILSNCGYGKCKKIMLDGCECSVDHLDVDDEYEFNIYFKGLENDTSDTKFTMFFSYQDIFGNTYSQKFSCHLRSDIKKINIEIGEPLLKGE